MAIQLGKVCTKCGRWKPLTGFHRHRGNPDGYAYKCKKCVAEGRARYYADHRDEAICYQQSYYHAHTLVYIERTRERAAANPERERRRCQKKQQRRRADMAQLLNTLTEAEWQEILVEWGHRCAYCGQSEGQFRNVLQQEHVIPLSQGGGYTLANIVPACPRCNLKKGARTPEQAGMNFMPMF